MRGRSARKWVQLTGHHDLQDEVNCARKLKHDDDEADGHSCDSSESTSSSNDRVDRRRDASSLGRTASKEPGSRMSSLNAGHHDADCASYACADREGGKKDAGGQESAEGDGRQESFGKGCHEEEADDHGSVGGAVRKISELWSVSFDLLQGRVNLLAETVRINGAAIGEEVADELGGRDSHEDDEVADDGSEER